MCGIAGFIDIECADPRSVLDGMLNSLGHRGPDDRGSLVAERVALGMTRLSIIDVEGGHQPQSALQGAVSIVFNGEVYNHAALRTELERLGHTFRTRSDTEVLLASYLEWGPEAIARFDGMFAVAIHDARSDRLLLARDRFGEKPLYYWLLGSGLVFASEPKAFRCVQSMPSIDETAVADYLQLGYTPGTKTIWHGLHKLAAGHVLVWERGSLSTKPYWQVQVVPQPERLDDAVDALEERLLEAVRTRLVSDVPVGVMLSGGVDSSLVAWAASRQVSELRTYTMAFDDPEKDESAAARATARSLGTSHHVARVGGQDALALVEHLPEIYDEPFADSSAIPTSLLARFVADDVKVVLTGDGGDEVFSGYRRYGYLARANERPKLPAPLVRGLASLAPSSSLPIARRISTAAALRDPSPARVYENLSGLLTRYQLRRLLKGAQPTALRATAECAFRRFGSAGPQVADLEMYLTDDLLVKMDRATMAYGLEARAPFLMPSLVEWGLSLQPHDRGAAGAKQLPRALLGRVLPGDLAQRPKQGFSVPLDKWLRGPLRHLVADLGTSYLVGAGYVDRRFILNLEARLDRHLAGAAPMLWALICFELWRQHWAVG